MTTIAATQQALDETLLRGDEIFTRLRDGLAHGIADMHVVQAVLGGHLGSTTPQILLQVQRCLASVKTIADGGLLRPMRAFFPQGSPNARGRPHPPQDLESRPIMQATEPRILLRGHGPQPIMARSGPVQRTGREVTPPMDGLDRESVRTQTHVNKQCGKCGTFGHIKKDCVNTKRPRVDGRHVQFEESPTPGDELCGKCGGKGHSIGVCTSK